MRRPADAGTTIVVKIGSSSLAGTGSGIDGPAIAGIADQVAELRIEGFSVVLVTSGAVAAGLPLLEMSERPRDVPGLQVAAAVGQGRLMEAYAGAFATRSLVVGQVLLTRDVLAERGQYLHAREALERMIALGVVPVVNENDTVVVDELKLGDNDRLAAIVCHLVGAGMLVILTDTEGLFTDDPRLVDDAELLQAVRHTDVVLDELRRKGSRGVLGSGGVATKVAAAQMAAYGGTPTVIASATVPRGALAAAHGEDIGTWVDPRPVRLAARKAWIAFGMAAAGTIHIDRGAVRALAEQGRSLLPAGVSAVDGSFDAAEAVEIVGPDRALVAKGVARMSASELRTVMGSHSSVAGGEAVHRDDLVVLVEESA